MAIFKRNDQGEAKKGAAAATAVLEEDPKAPHGGMAPPFVSRAASPQAASTPGVVPPPAAPIYSMRPPQSELRFELDAESALAGKVKAASEQAKATQEVVQKRLRVAVQRSKTDAPATNGARRTAPSSALRLPARQSFDPARAAQAGLLNLAWSWQEAGAPIRAIHAYMQLLCRYPDTPAAAAAVADLVELSDSLAAAGQFHIALAIYDQLEQLV